jgi:hypothetical protein
MTILSAAVGWAAPNLVSGLLEAYIVLRVGKFCDSARLPFLMLWWSNYISSRCNRTYSSN